MTDLEILAFKSSQVFRKWLVRAHGKSPGIWLRLFKKASGEKSISYDEALHEALCFGWIDGQKKSFDDKSWIQRFTPRRKKSIWSKRNTVIVQKLIKEKKMKPAGLKAVEEAKADGRWERAYAGSKNMTIPPDFLEQLRKNRQAHEFFQTLNKTNLYAIGWRLHTAKKSDTRTRRMVAIIEMLAAKKKLHGI